MSTLWQHAKCPFCKGRVPIGLNQFHEMVLSLHFGPNDITPCPGSGTPSIEPENWTARDNLEASPVHVGYD